MLSIAAELEAVDFGSLPLTHGETMQSEFLLPLRESNPAAAAELHGSGSAAPFGRGYTISPLFMLSGITKMDGYWKFRPAAKCWFRLTAYRERAMEALWHTVSHRTDWHLFAGGHNVTFRIRRWITPRDRSAQDLDASGWIKQASVESLQALAKRSPVKRIHLQFITPTAFGRNHSENGNDKWNNTVPLPAPAHVWGSLYRNWVEAFPDQWSCPGPPPAWNHAWFENRIALGKFAINSEMMSFGKRKSKVPGFIGAVEFDLDNNMAEEERRFLWMLSEFSQYCGVGKSTSWGMGQVRRSERKMS